MSTFSGSPAEMPIVPPRAERPFPDEATAERLLSGHGVGPDAPPDQRALALVLEAAARPATEWELAGERAAVAAFLATAGKPRLLSRPRIGTRPLYRRIPVLAAAGVVALVIAFGGTAAAGALPAPLQNVAHQVFGAPAPTPGPAVPVLIHKSPTGTGTPSPSPSVGSSKDKATAPPGKAKSQQTPKSKGDDRGKGKGSNDSQGSSSGNGGSGNGGGGNAGGGSSSDSSKGQSANGNAQGNSNNQGSGNGQGGGNSGTGQGGTGNGNAGNVQGSGHHGTGGTGTGTSISTGGNATGTRGSHRCHRAAVYRLSAFIPSAVSSGTAGPTFSYPAPTVRPPRYLACTPSHMTASFIHAKAI